MICIYIYMIFTYIYILLFFSKFPTGFACAGCGQLAKCSDVLFCPIDFQGF